MERHWVVFLKWGSSLYANLGNTQTALWYEMYNSICVEDYIDTHNPEYSQKCFGKDT